MRSTTLNVQSHVQLTSTATNDTKTSSAPRGASAVMMSCATNDARVTLDGSTPTTSNGFLLKKDLNPHRFDVGLGTTVSLVSTVAGNSVVDLVWLG